MANPSIMIRHLSFTIVFTLFSVLAFGQKDTLTLSNSDVLVGTIEKMDRSILTFSTSYDDSDFNTYSHPEQISSRSYF